MMIIRNIGARHGRRVLAASASRPCLRTLSTQFTQKPTTTAASSREDEIQAALSAAQAYSRQKAEDAALKAELDKIPESFHKYQHIKKHTTGLGSHVESLYDPEDMLKNPPSEATLEMLMAAQAHMGHNTSLWNPSNSRYIYGVRAGIHIISLETTSAHLRRAARVVEEVAYHGGLILFVGTRKGQKQIVVRAAELAGGCHLFQKWTPGTITNRDQILSSGHLRMVDAMDRDVPGYESHLQDRRPLLPDLVVCLNPVENYSMLHECGLDNVPTIGIIDTDADPTWVTYQIPANDDSLRSVSLIAGVLGRAGEKGQRRRLAAAAEGEVTWLAPADVMAFINKDAEEKILARRAAQARDGEEDDELKEQLSDEAIREAFGAPVYR